MPRQNTPGALRQPAHVTMVASHVVNNLDTTISCRLYLFNYVRDSMSKFRRMNRSNGRVDTDFLSVRRESRSKIDRATVDRCGTLESSSTWLLLTLLFFRRLMMLFFIVALDRITGEETRFLFCEGAFYSLWQRDAAAFGVRKGT